MDLLVVTAQLQLSEGPGMQSHLAKCIAGHANVQTDIKEATFMGSHDDLVAAGSDDGSVYIYEAATGQVVKILQADEDVANCVQVCCLLADTGHGSSLFSIACHRFATQDWQRGLMPHITALPFSFPEYVCTINYRLMRTLAAPLPCMAAKDNH